MKTQFDPRRIKAGDIFVSLKKDQALINEAVTNEARKVVTSNLRRYVQSYRKKLNSQIIAVTGTSGKTTVKNMLYHILAQKYNTVRSPGNFSNEIGVAYTLLNSCSDTEIVILELPLDSQIETKRLLNLIQPTHLIVNGFSKKQLKKIRNLLQYTANLRFLVCPDNYIDYEQAGDSGLKNKPTCLTFQGFDLHDQNMNICYTLGQLFNIESDLIAKGLASYQSLDNRLKKITANGITLINDTYSDNPQGFTFALQYLRRYQDSRRKIIVLGDLKETSLNFHDLIDNEVSMVFSLSLKKDSLPFEGVDVFLFTDRDSLHEILKAELKTGDLVLIKGSRSVNMRPTVEFLTDYTQSKTKEYKCL